MNQIQADPTTRALNRRLGGMRYVVECAFGILKNRFRILLNPLECARNDPRFATDLITSLMVLHNFCILENDEMQPDLMNQDVNAQQIFEIGENEEGDGNINYEDATPSRNILYEHISYQRRGGE